MIFIGIAIFTVYTMQTFYVGGCDPHWSTDVICADVAKTENREFGRKEPIYIGEFKSIESCQEASRARQYLPKAGERVEAWSEVLCLPKGAP